MSIQLSTYNIAFMGKAGVGKSSLINYLFNTDVAKADIVFPVTPFGFHIHNQEINGVNYSFFDSSGIEVKNQLQWMNLLDSEFRKRDEKQPAYNWFHGIIYCVSCAGSRFEPIDVDIIKKCLANDYRVIIALTWSDSISKDKVDEYKSIVLGKINSDKISVIPICNVEGENYFGKIQKFGREDIMKEIVNNFWHLIIKRLPKRCKSLLVDKVNSWDREQNLNLKNMSSGIGGYFSANSAHSEIREKSLEFTKLLNTQTIEIIKQETILAFSIFDQFSKSQNITTKLNSLKLNLNPTNMVTEDHFWDMVGGFLWSGMATMWLGEIIGISKASAYGGILIDLEKYTKSVLKEIDSIELKYSKFLEENINLELNSN